VAVNPTNPSNMIVTFGTGTTIGDNVEIAHVSNDGGNTWRMANTSLSYEYSVLRPSWTFYDAVATFDANGNAYVGTVDNAWTNASYLFKSTDGGDSFKLTSPFLKTSDNLVNYGNGSIVHACNQPFPPGRDYPAVIADPYSGSPYRNNVYVFDRTSVFLNGSCRDFGFAFERSSDGGSTWGSGTWFRSALASFLSDNRGMAVAPDGTLFLAGLGPSCGARCVVVFRSVDGGSSFQELSVNIPQISLGVVEVVAASATTLYLLIFGTNGSLAGYHLYSIVSHDGGVSWSTLVRIDDGTNPNGGATGVAANAHPMWDLSLSQRSGRLDVAWFDYRNNPPAPTGNWTLADIYYSYSYDGISWASNLRVTQGPYYYCINNSGGACSGAGNDFMWITSPDTPGLDRAYIVASLGATACGNTCTDGTLYTRFVTVTFSSTNYALSWQGYDWDGAHEETITLNGRLVASLPATDSFQNGGVYVPFSLNVTSFVVKGANTLTFTHANWDCSVSDNVRALQVTGGGTVVYSNTTILPLSCTQSLTHKFTIGSAPSPPPPPPLGASFTYSPTSPTIGGTVTFTATATGGISPYSFSWRFGDGSTGSGGSATHSYSAQGTYEVILTVQDSMSPSNSLTTTSSLTVSPPSPPPLSASFAYSPSNPSVNQAVVFTATASGGVSPYSFNWNFGDGTVGSGSSVTHSYSSPATYTVVLTVHDSASPSHSQTASQSVTVSSSSSSSAYIVSWQGYDWDGGHEETITLNGRLVASLPATDSFQNGGVWAPFSLNVTSFVVKGTNTLTFSHANWDCSVSDSVKNLQVTTGTAIVYGNPTLSPLSCTQSLTYTFTV
jgi:PKD repeat protein